MCALWKLAEPKSDTHAHVPHGARSTEDDSPPPPGPVAVASSSAVRRRAPKQRENGLSEMGACSRKGLTGMNGSSREWARPRGEKRPRNESRGEAPREGEGERCGEPVRERVRVCDSALFLRP